MLILTKGHPHFSVTHRREEPVLICTSTFFLFFSPRASDQNPFFLQRDYYAQSVTPSGNYLCFNFTSLLALGVVSPFPMQISALSLSLSPREK